MNRSTTGQVSGNAAEVYEAFFLPALFRQWTGRMIEAAGIQPGERVVDIACGTGVLARAIAEHVGASGSVTGVDVNEGMLAVAQRIAPEIVWQQGRAEDLPLPSGHFDAAVCQFGLMFFTDRKAALGEMMRVLRPGGRLAVAVWESQERLPGYAALTALLQRLFGQEAADTLRPPFVLGDTNTLASLLAEAGIARVQIAPHPGTARFPSLAAWLHTDVKGWTLAEMIDDEQFDVLVREAQHELRRFVLPDGTVEFDAPALIASASKP